MPIDLSQNAVKILESRYLKRDDDRNVAETPEEMFERVAKAVAQAELLLNNAREADLWEEAFLKMLQSLDFLPNSPTLMNAGTSLGQLSACFVLPVKDTMEDIFDSIKKMALVQRTGGGTGFSFSRLRPKNELIASTAGTASGPVSFMHIFDCATAHIKQGGKRRGANMAVLRVDHPDILDFIQAKRNAQILQNFNLSVAVTDAFMNAVQYNKRYSLIHPGRGNVSGSLKAGEVFDAITEAAWQTGDPGLIFVDTINRDNPTPQLGVLEATNPCGEIPLLSFESCNLGSINLAHMLDQGGQNIDRQKLCATTRKAVRFLDNVIEVNRYCLPQIEQMSRGNRKIGLGVMGFSEMLIRLGISYDSDEALQNADKIMKTIAREALEASRELAGQRGVYPNWHGSVHEFRELEMRNATCTAVAPTGTIGIIADTTPSIEPLFALAYRRSHVLEEQVLYEINPLFRNYANDYGLDAENLVRQVVEKGRLADVKDVPEDLRRLFVTAHEVSAERHLQMQAAFQRHVDNCVSKTVNMPHAATSRDVAVVYRQAWELGLKGVTIYRYGSKSRQVLELGAEEQPHHYDHSSKCDPEECRV
jgi:ribonucleoside-diphosphate reductase alpha chain